MRVGRDPPLNFRPLHGGPPFRRCPVLHQGTLAHLSLTRFTAMSSPFVESQELCQLLGVSLATLGRYVEAQTLPEPIRLSKRKRLWKRAEVQQRLGIEL